MDFLYQHGRATAAEVQANLPEPPSYSAVRAMLRVLETKGHLRHVLEGKSYVWVPTLGRGRASRSALQNMSRDTTGQYPPWSCRVHHAPVERRVFQSVNR